MVEHLTAPDVHLVILAKYGYLRRVRELCRGLSLDKGFSEDEAFDIALAVDEIVSNAFEHGCNHPSDDCIDVKISFSGATVFVAVRDPGGKDFDYHKYKNFEPGPEDGIASGLYLVDKFADGWVVNTEPGEYTEVMFFKRKAKKE